MQNKVCWNFVRPLLGFMVSIAFTLGMLSCNLMTPQPGPRKVQLDFSATFASLPGEIRLIQKGVFTSAFDTITLEIAELDQAGAALVTKSYSITASTPSLEVNLKSDSAYSLKLTTTMTQSYALDAQSTAASHSGSWSQTVVIVPSQEPIVNFKPARLSSVPQTIDLLKNASQATSMTVSSSRDDQTAIAYQILDNAIATVDQSGSVQAMAPGQTWLIATPVDGGFSSFVPITVTDFYVVTYNANFPVLGGAGSGMPPSDSNQYLLASTASIQDNSGSLATTGYTFGGWNARADGTGTAYATSSTVAVTSNIDLYAVWSPISYAIIYTLDGGTNNIANPASYTIESPALALSSPSRAGHGFYGWFTDSSFTTATTSIPAASTGSITLWAKWTASAYTITYNLNGGINNLLNPNSYTSSSPQIVFAAPVYSGYDFAGWYGDSGFISGVSGIDSGSSGDIAVYAKWTAASLNIAFDPQGGTAATGQTVNFASTYGSLPTTTRVGYTFAGWWTGAGGTGTQVQATTTVSNPANHTLYAKWNVNTYSITFDANSATGGTTPGSLVKNHGTGITIPGNTGALTRTGYSFLTWNTQADGNGTNVAASSTYTGESDLLLYAKWSPDAYTVDYLANGSDSGTAPVAQTKFHDIPLTLAGNAGGLSKTGYTFAGWNTAAGGGGAAYAVGGSYTNNGSVTLYAAWTNLPTYTISYSANGASSGTAPIAQTKIQGSPVTLATNSGSLALAGYTFAGWNTQSDGSGTSYAQSASYASDAAITLYATWTINTYNIVYNANGATSGTPPASQVKTHNIDNNLQSNSGVLAKTGYTFSGWNTAANGSGTTYAEGALNSLNANLTLYAKWTIDTYSVTYNGNGNTGGTAPTSQTKTYDAALTLSGVGSLVKSGYIFAGWNTQSDGTGTSYAGGASYTTNAALILFARWSIAYTVTYNANGATSGTVPGNQIAANGSVVTVAANPGTLDRAGYLLAGWNTAADGSGTSYALGSGTFTITANTTLYARWVGKNWESITSNSDGTKLAAVSYGGNIHTSTDSGLTWTIRESKRTWRDIASDSTGTYLAAVVFFGKIYTSTDAGVTWYARESTRNWQSIASDSTGAKLVAVVGNANTSTNQIYTSTDYGVTWTARDSARNWLSVASSSDGTKLVAGADGGFIYTSTDSGVTWTARGTTHNWYSITSSSDGTKLAAAPYYSSQIYTSTNSGANWTARASAQNWYSITGDSTGTKLAAVVEGGQIYTSTDSGGTWTARESARIWHDITSDSTGTKLVAVENGGHIYTSTDSGVTWTMRY